ncbi:MAG: methyltransferase domain-containing protein [Pseudomonadales bacterium]
MDIYSEIPQRERARVERDEMDWDAYAQHYDELCALNPAYEQNIQALLAYIREWELPADASVCDLGAGTGNYIIELNRVLPKANYWHVDFDVRMNELAAKKYHSNGLSSVKILHKEIHEVQFSDDSFDLIVCVNALYTFTPQRTVLENMRRWLKPSGKLFLIDFGREQSTLDWTFYIFREAMKAHRVGRYARALVEAREVLKQNRKATKGQQSGRYWLHSTEELGGVLQDVGFTVRELRSCYRDYADLAICTK